MVSGIHTIDTNHEDMIHDAQLDYFGTTLATASSDNSIKIFDVRNKKQLLIAHLKEHQGPVWSLSWSHPMFGSLLASCSYDRKVIIWRETSGRWDKFYEYSEHASSVNCVCWAPHPYGPMLACASSDGSISIFQLDENNLWRVHRISDADSIGVNSVSWAPAINADFLINPLNIQTVNQPVKRIVSGGCDSSIKIWREDSSSGTTEWIEECRLEGHSEWVRDVAWSPSLNIHRQLIASCGGDGRLIIWQSVNNINNSNSSGNNANNKALHHNSFMKSADEHHQPQNCNPNDQIKSGRTVWQPTVLCTYQNVVWHLSWSVTGNLLAVSGADNKVTLWKENTDGNWVALSEIVRGNPTLDETSQISNPSLTPLVT